MNENASSNQITKLPSISALPAGISLQEFEITGVLGEGGFGIVYLARDRLLGREVAIKEYMPASLAARGTDRGVVVRSRSHEQTFAAGLQSFMTEARLLAQFKHPALVEIFRFWEQNGTAYMAMPFYRGQTLKQYLKANPQLIDEQWLRKLLLPLLDGLEHLHSASCYHRDIAPDNILILENGQPLLLDFGAARRIVGDATANLTVILKPGYAPVEQYADDASVAQGPWTDIYGLAAICHYAITGNVPPASVTRLMRDPMAPLVSQAIPGYSKQLLLGVDRGLAVKPEHRPQTIAEFRKLLGLDPQLDLTFEETPVAVPVAQPTQPPATIAAPPPPTAAPTVAKPIVATTEVPPLPDASPTSTASKRFAFLRPGAKNEAPTVAATAQPTVDVKPNVVATEPTPPSKGKKGSAKKKDADKQAAQAMSSLNEDTVILGAQKPPLAATVEHSMDPTADAQSEPRAKRGNSMLIAISMGLLAVCVALGIWLFAGAGKSGGGDASASKSTSSTSVESKTSGTQDPPKATPEPPPLVPLASDSPTATTGTPATSTDTIAMQEKAKADELARLDAEKAAAEEKAKADEKEKARLAMSGTVVLNIAPWGEVFVNGQSRGASPPRKRLSLIEGKYSIMIKNGGFEPFLTVVEVKRGQEHLIAHQFK
ncbi:MAG: protein kinase domain-containing protein [Casimicrobium sp.]